MLTMMNRAGCWQIDFGLESGDDEILKKMQKDATVDDARRAIEWTKKAGINCRAYFVLGMPGETPETIRRTVKFAKQMKLDLVTFYYVVLYPGNDLYKIAQKEGKILHHEFTQYTSLIDTKKAHLHYLPQGMTESTMLKEISRAYRSYYFSPRYLLRQLFSIRSLYDINRLWKGFKSVLKL
jgi:radical SAM superfamily enzyme YgiQ (UPF0313 family)